MNEAGKIQRNQVNTAIDEATAAALDEIERNFGPKPPAVVRLALADFLPRYLAGQGKTENVELFAQIGEALKRDPSLRGEIERLIKRCLRGQRRAAA